MNSLLKIALATPWYAWVGLFYLLFVGIRATRNRVVHVYSLFIMPAFLIALKYRLFTDLNFSLLLIYVLWTCFGTLVGFRIAEKISVQVLKTETSLKLKGEYVTLVILLAFFSAKYVFGYLQSTQPDLPIGYALAETALTGFCSGAFLGRSLCFFKKFRSVSKKV